jgi:Protein of unknown function (DUF1236)
MPMRNTLLKSSALAALLVATSFAYAQAPEPHRGEAKSEKSEKATPPAAHSGQAEQNRERSAQSEQRQARPEQKGAEQRSAAPEHNRAGNERSNRNAAEENKRPGTLGQGAEPGKTQHNAGKNAEEQRKSAQEQNKGAAEQRKSAEDQRKNAEEQRKSAEEQRKNAEEQRKNSAKNAEEQRKNDAERNQADKNKSTAGTPEQEKQSTQTPGQNQQPTAQSKQPSPTSNSAQQNQPSPNTNRAQQNPPSPATNSAQQNNEQNRTQQNTAVKANQLQPQKKVEISEKISHSRDIAPPERNINVSINVGTVVPSHVRFHRLPREVWEIEPQYRDYDYFTTEEDIVIVEPRTHRIVSLVPRDPARARREVTEYSSSGGRVSSSQSSQSRVSGSSATAQASPCQIMRRDPSSGQLSEVRPQDLSRSTVGSGGGQNDQLTVTVQMGNDQPTPPIPLDARAGQVVASTQGNGDCQITIEPERR